MGRVSKIMFTYVFQNPSLFSETKKKYLKTFENMNKRKATTKDAVMKEGSRVMIINKRT